MANHHILIIHLGFTLGLVASACVTTSDPNPAHCRNAQGDQTCAERYGEARAFCTTDACDATSEQFSGCVATRPSDDCYYPCGDNNDVTVDDSCLVAGDDDMGDGDGDTTGADMADGDGDATGDGDGDTPCTGQADCTDDAAPFCNPDTGACVGCGGTEDPDGACASLDPQLSVCLADACVACSQDQAQACVGDTPVCDPQTNACVGCSDHEQCPDSACNLVLGSCFDPAATLHVDGDADCDSGDGTQEKPYCELGDALSDVDATLIILHEPDMGTYHESVVISSTIALFAAETEDPVLTGPPGQAPISVTTSGRLFARGLVIAGTQGGVGLEVSSGQAWVEGSKIVNNADGGVIVDGGGRLVLENSFVGGLQGQPIIDLVAGEVAISFSTIGAGFGMNSRAIACTNGSGSTLRNSILVSYSPQPEIDCPDLLVLDSFTEIDSGETFEELSGWFVDFDAGDFHLVPNMYPDIIESLAIWRSGDPPIDIDGKPRPSTDESPDFAGADRLP